MSYVYNICSLMSDSPPYFCYITITNKSVFISNCITSSLSILLGAYIVYKFCKMRGSHNRHTAFVYGNMIAWWVTFVASVVFSYWLYYQSGFEKQTPQPNPQYSDAQMSNKTKYYFIIDWINLYFIQLLLLYVPYHWCKQICMLFNGSMRQSAVESSLVPSKPYEGLQTKIYPFLRIYIIFRLIEIAMPIIFACADWGVYALFKIQVGCMLLDCVIIMVSLALGMYSLKKSKTLIELLDSDQLTQMFNRYLLISIATFIRFAFNVYFFTDALNDDRTFKKACPFKQKSEDPIVGVIMDVSTILLLHYLPIFLITRMYTLEERPQQICSSLIITTTTSGQGQGLLQTD